MFKIESISTGDESDSRKQDLIDLLSRKTVTGLTKNKKENSSNGNSFFGPSISKSKNSKYSKVWFDDSLRNQIAMYSNQSGSHQVKGHLIGIWNPMRLSPLPPPAEVVLQEPSTLSVSSSHKPDWEYNMKTDKAFQDGSKVRDFASTSELKRSESKSPSGY
ncbi:uncharacterized protein L201_006526 [Kwoniella dendrophila CBS 6074]|uniref:Mso1 N-terminal domain-containing protein n=1 Tax=Kwoniella dendrophila CBS 6074 TaxID=1295534 RepID=A0AAX4K483_9TREE